MATQLSVAVRNARLDAIEAAIGASAKLKLRTGAPPENCAAADSGTVLCAMNLPADYLAAAGATVAGRKDKAGVWSGVGIGGGGTIGHYRTYANDGVTCHMQGTVTITEGGGDMEVDNPDVENDQVITVTAFELTDANG